MKVFEPLDRSVSAQTRCFGRLAPSGRHERRVMRLVKQHETSCADPTLRLLTPQHSKPGTCYFSARRCTIWQYAPGPLRKLLRRKNSLGAWICSSMSPQAKLTV